MKMLTKKSLEESLHHIAIRLIEELEGLEDKGVMLLAVRDNPDVAAKVMIPSLERWSLAMSMETRHVGLWDGEDFRDRMIYAIHSRFRREIAILPRYVW